MSQPATTRFTRPQAVAAAIKRWIVERGLSPGDRLPGEAETMRMFGASKGTVREALRLLEAQGLIRTRTGPGGGAFVHAVSEARARALLGNYFYFKEVGLRHVYALRRLLEPALVAELAGRLTEEELARLEAAVARTEVAPATPEAERESHLASLGFHMALAEMAENPILGFLVGFLADYLRALTVARGLYEPPNPALHARGRDYQERLIAALRAGDAEGARAVMAEHMETAQAMMEAQAALARRFLEEGRGFSPDRR